MLMNNMQYFGQAMECVRIACFLRAGVQTLAITFARVYNEIEYTMGEIYQYPNSIL